MIDSFLIQKISQCPLDDVLLIYDAEWDRYVPREQQKQALIKWYAINRERKYQCKPALQDLLLFRPGSIRQNTNGIQISCGMTTYLANVTFSAPTDHWSKNLLGAGLSIVPVCIDNKILIGRRSAVVYQGQGRFHVTGGHAHPKPDFRTHPDTLHNAVLQELNEEMNIPPSEIKSLEFLGIGFDQTTSKPEFLARARLKKRSHIYIRQWEEERKKNMNREFDELTTLDILLNKGGHSANFTIACRMALKVNGIKIL